MTKAIRCAIYTRKSTEEGLEQAFNSLDAQREACAAYVLSQQHEGWGLSPELYDDGGFSGGTMERPGLRQLLDDVRVGKVDVIVVYKVDRLTRSLADFAKIVEILDAAGASFVSVTQSFNTTSSMGRLTLNVLLSFAQFEREVTGERIRDKVAASKAKGMWMGGVVPLGYDVIDKALVVNDAEARTVRQIFERYVALGSIGQMAEELASAGIRSKLRTLSSGEQYGGRKLTKGALAHLLQNPVYIGEIRHKELRHKGMQAPIIPHDLWLAVQQKLAANRHAHVLATRAEQPSLLAGMIRDGEGRSMSPSHTAKGSRRYRYYVSRTDGAGGNGLQWRLPAGDIERLVQTRVTALLAAPEEFMQRLESAGGAEHLQSTIAKCAGIADAGITRELLVRLKTSVDVHDDRIIVTLFPGCLLTGDSQQQAESDQMVLEVPATLKRRGSELRLMIEPRDAAVSSDRDSRLIALLAKARSALSRLASESLLETKSERMHLMRVSRLNYLAPDIVAAIIQGRQPPQLTARSLLRAANIPLDWREQRSLLGFA